jgi:hypothetical protein
MESTMTINCQALVIHSFRLCLLELARTPTISGLQLLLYTQWYTSVHSECIWTLQTWDSNVKCTPTRLSRRLGRVWHISTSYYHYLATSLLRIRPYSCGSVRPTQVVMICIDSKCRATISCYCSYGILSTANIFRNIFYQKYMTIIWKYK